MLHRITAAIVFVIFSAVSAQAMTVEFRFLGQPYRWKEPERAPLGPQQDWPALIRHEEASGRSIALALADIAKRYPLDDYGRLMLLRELALAVPLDKDEAPVGFHAAWGRRWGPTSRAVFVAAQLNLQGIRAAVFQAAGRPLVGIPVADPDLNARMQTIVLNRRSLLSSREIQRKFVLWDIDGRIGLPDGSPVEPHMLTPPEDLFDHDDGRPVDFRRRELPAKLWARMETGIFQWPGGKAVAYSVFPDVAAYLQLYPEHWFSAQLALEHREMHRSGLGTLLLAFSGVTEQVFVSRILQAVQMNFKYEQGPLRSAQEILISGKGDCDQLSLILALLLLDVGYQPRAMSVVLWQDADHLGLALRPHKDLGPMPGAAYYAFDTHRYYVLDTTFYNRREEELVTSWGEMAPENVIRKATLIRLPEVL